MGKKKSKPDVAKLNFEQAIGALTEVVEQIEDGQIPLSESLEKYERGMALIRRCRQILAEAEERIEKIGAENLAKENRSGREDEPEDESDEAEAGDEGLF